MRRWTRGDRQRGATAIEYALMVGLVVGFIVVLIAMLGRQAADMLDTVPRF